MNNEQAVKIAFASFVEEFGADRFSVSENRVKMWTKILSDISADVVLAAVAAVLASDREYPPTVGHVRARCIDMMTGGTTQETAIEAWESVLDMIADRKGPDELTQKCKRALRHVGGSWAVAHTEQAGFIRSQFVAAYNGYHERDRVTIGTLPAVRNIEDKRLTALTAQIGGKK